MADVLLVYPGMSQRATNFPYSLLPIAGYLLEHGHNVRILDLQVESDRDVNPRDYDIVGISSYTGSQIEGGIRFADLVRRQAPGVPIVWGGVHASMTARQTIEHPVVDIVVRGEGEITLLNIIDALDKGEPLQGVNGLTLKVDGQVVETRDAAFMDPDAIPFSPYQLIKTDRYTFMAQEPPLVCMQSSRGCPHSCGFCYGMTMHRRTWRAKSAERVVDEMEHAVDSLKAGIICFGDDNFSVKRSRVQEIAEGIIERQLRLEWRITSRFDYVAGYEPDFLTLLKQSGCNEIACSAEFGCQRLLDLIEKNITPDIIRDGLRKLSEGGIPCPVGLMAGYPTETFEETRMTFDLVDELMDIHRDAKVAISIYTPYPGTPLYPLALEHGFKDRTSLDEWGQYKFGVVENLPWLSRRHRDVLRIAGLICRSTFIAPTYTKPVTLRNKRATVMAHRILYESARFRWKHRFFNPAPEWRLVDLVLKVTNSWER